MLRRIVVAACAASVVFVLPGPSVVSASAAPRQAADADVEAEEPDGDDDAVDPAVEAAAQEMRAAERARDGARAGLRAAVAATGRAVAAGRAADGGVRRSEDALPDAVLSVRVATVDLVVAERELAEALERRREVTGELSRARRVLADQALRTFKTGRSSELTGPVAVLREARDPGQLVRALADLRAVTRDGARSVKAIEAELDGLDERIDDAQVRRDEAETASQVAHAALEGAEAVAAAARDTARAAEAAVVAAMGAELAAGQELLRAEDRHARALERAIRLDVPGVAAVTAARTGSAAPDDVDLDERADQLAGRRRALDRAGRLPASARRTVDGWSCPIVGASFVNDWAFPRSGARRHEGTDVFAARGTPVVAVAAGTVTVVDTTDGVGDLGGVTVTVAEGTSRQYYAHLERVAPGLREGDPVAAGDAIGTVGTTGNARGTPPHLHLGWYVEDVAVNPFASLAVACADQGWRVPMPASTAR